MQPLSPTTTVVVGGGVSGGGGGCETDPIPHSFVFGDGIVGVFLVQDLTATDL
jgi:small ligand-binding sensory domain FIST